MNCQPSSWEDFVKYETSQFAATQKISPKSFTRISEGFLTGRLEQRNSLESMQNPSVLFPDLRADPWHDPAQYKWAKFMEDHYQQIFAELNTLIDSKAFRPHSEFKSLAQSGQ
ncbi:MAG: hypothetical protein HC764_22500 [Pleurocapsa sp. CRU_1_2]|nr:hypothetical protein [Pleurocapsa sp. CRU_1_2]